MDDVKKTIEAKDYAEPRCPLSGETYGSHPEYIPVPQMRIIEKMNEYMGRRDYEGAERHLKYWLTEALLGQDRRGELMIRGELIGHYRKTGNREAALKEVDEVLRLLREMNYEKSLSAGTAYVNAATACNAFGENERSLELFEKARSVYESSSRTDPELLGGLYNNMGLLYTSLSRYDDAFRLYDLAMEMMRKCPGGELEMAITCLNRADALSAKYGTEAAEKDIYDLLDKALDLLKNTEAPKDGYYAFVLEKCAPTFKYYGYFTDAEELKQEAEQIYKG